MKQHEKSLFKSNDPGLFSIMSSIPHLLIIVLVIACYYFIDSKGYFPLWITWIYYGTKTIIALEIFIAAGKSLIVPLLAIGLGLLGLYLIQVNYVQILSTNNAWQLIVIGAIAFCLTFIVRSLKR